VQACLYDPADGFYARGSRIGRRGAFATGPTLHGAFGDAVAATIAGAATVLEAGPGDGTLAERLLGVTADLVLLEPAAGMRRMQAERLGDRVRFADEPAEVEPFDGAIVANEVLDALPFRLLRWPEEVFVGVGADGRFREELRPTDLSAPVAAPRTGGRYAVRPALAGFLTALVAPLRSGRVVLIDYGGEGLQVHDGRRDPVRTYVAGAQGSSAVQAPGSQDITADVDFAVVRELATSLGLREVSFEPQAAWLRRHGAHTPRSAMERDDADWRLSRLLDEALPFQVLVLER
jgi:SAM-dependent MidA family methyltransferase